MFDRPADADRCVASLAKGCDNAFQILVVDHGLTSWTIPHDIACPVKVLRAGSDLWWTGATNAGIKVALAGGASKVMLLNADCTLDGRDARRLFEASRTAIVAPVQRSATTHEVTSAGARTALLLGFPTLRAMKKLPRRQDLVPVPMIIGGRGAVIPAEIFLSVGLFDEEQLPHYLADHDFYLRCRSAGFPLYVDTGASVFVDESTTSIAAAVGLLRWADFRDSLRSRRSHRNWTTIRAFYRKQYPVRWAYLVGASLNALRYLAAWAFSRPRAMIRVRQR